MNKKNKHFYRDISEINEFSQTVDLDCYTPMPDDWLIIVTDIRGSTEAINAGKYKSVNMAGATAIAAICNEFPDLDIPFVFGGDGAMLAIPDVGQSYIMGLLRFCSDATRSAFGLELAAGCRTMGELRKVGKEIKIGKYKLSNNVHQALFWGSGVDYVEEIIKKPVNDLYKYKMVHADLKGLECRWNEILSDKDEVLSIIISSTIQNEGEKSRFYKLCLEKIENIYGTPDQYSPVSESELSLAASPFKLRDEVNLRSFPANSLKKLYYHTKLAYLQIAGRSLMKFRVKTNNTNWGNYKRDFVQNADFRKFSDSLKLVVSGTVEQRRKIRSFLEKHNEKGNVVFGLHASPAAMTTCFVTNYKGQHIHFVDGTEGGYARASVELKQQMKEFNSIQTINSFVKKDAKKAFI